MAPSSRRTRRSWSQRLLISFNILVVIACLATAWGLTLVRQKLSKVQVVSLGVSLAPQVSADEPRNILIIGTDSAARLDPKDPIRRQRPPGEDLADVVMIMRLDPKDNTAALLSIPRDSWVPIAPFGTKAKINSAISGPNGAQNLIETIKENFAISIDNYVEIDFEGFRALVQALGGIPVYLTEPVRDRNTGLFLTQTGCITLDPVQSLAYARSRHFEYLDPKTKKWTSDPSSDLGRISRQQDFIELAAQRAVEEGARNPATALSLIDAAKSAVTIDSTMTIGQMRDMADRFGNFNVKNLQKYQLPTSSGGNSTISYQNVNWDAAQPMLDIFRGLVYGQPITPRNVQVEVATPATATTADAVVADLAKQGFDSDVQTATDRNAATHKSSVTTIRYGARGRVAAGLLARWLDATVTFSYQPDLQGARLDLLPGADFKGVRTSPLPESAVQAPSLSQATTTTVKGLAGAPSRSTTTTTATPASGSDQIGATSASTTTSGPPETTTTAAPIGIVPVDSNAQSKCT